MGFIKWCKEMLRDPDLDGRYRKTLQTEDSKPNIETEEQKSVGQVMVKCVACKEIMTKQEYESAWDWSGPHCPRCGAGGMSYFADMEGPIQSGRNFINQCEEALKKIKRS